MSKGRLFRRANAFLFLATCLSGALLVAPIAYASNYTAKVHAEIYGTWVRIDRDMGDGVDAVSFRHIWQLPLHWPYAIIGLALTFTLFRAMFTNANDFEKLHRARRGFWLAVLYGLCAVLIRAFALNIVGKEALPDQLESGFLREMLFIFFILYFIYRAQGKILPHTGLFTHGEPGKKQGEQPSATAVEGGDDPVVV